MLTDQLPTLPPLEDIYDFDIFQLNDLLALIDQNINSTQSQSWNKKANKLRDIISLELQERQAIENFGEYCLNDDFDQFQNQNKQLQELLLDIQKPQEQITINDKTHDNSKQDDEHSTVSDVSQVSRFNKIRPKKNDMFEFMKNVLSSTRVDNQQHVVGTSGGGKYQPPPKQPELTATEKVKLSKLKKQKQQKFEPQYTKNTQQADKQNYITLGKPAFSNKQLLQQQNQRQKEREKEREKQKNSRSSSRKTSKRHENFISKTINLSHHDTTKQNSNNSKVSGSNQQQEQQQDKQEQIPEQIEERIVSQESIEEQEALNQQIVRESIENDCKQKKMNESQGQVDSQDKQLQSKNGDSNGQNISNQRENNVTENEFLLNDSGIHQNKIDFFSKLDNQTQMNNNNKLSNNSQDHQIKSNTALIQKQDNQSHTQQNNQVDQQHNQSNLQANQLDNQIYFNKQPNQLNTQNQVSKQGNQIDNSIMYQQPFQQDNQVLIKNTNPNQLNQQEIIFNKDNNQTQNYQNKQQQANHQIMDEQPNSSNEQLIHNQQNSNIYSDQPEIPQDQSLNQLNNNISQTNNQSSYSKTITTSITKTMTQPINYDIIEEEFEAEGDSDNEQFKPQKQQLKTDLKKRLVKPIKQSTPKKPPKQNIVQEAMDLCKNMQIEDKFYEETKPEKKQTTQQSTQQTTQQTTQKTTITIQEPNQKTQNKKPRVPPAPRPKQNQNPNPQSKYLTKILSEINDENLVDYSALIPSFQHLFSGFLNTNGNNYSHIDQMREIYLLFCQHVEKVDNVDNVLSKYSSISPNDMIYINDPKKVVVYAQKTGIDMVFNSRIAGEHQKFNLYFRVVKTKDEVYDIITRSFMRKTNWSELPHGLGLKTSWNLLWTWSKPQIDMNKLLIFQKVNHFPFNKNLSRKDLLKKNIERCQRLGQKANQTFDIIPQTFLLPKEYVQFMERFYYDLEREGEWNIWIMKPTSKSRGRGIQVINDITQVMYSEPVILQKYLKNPLLLRGYKFDMRIYVLVTSFNPLEAFLYKEGFARMTTQPFSLEINDLKNNLVHLTNYAVQRTHVGDGMDQSFGGCKISLRQLKDKLRDKGIDWKMIWQQTHDIIIKSLVATQCDIPSNQNAFELFGYDIIIDSDLRCWLLEVNSSPSLAREYLLDELVKQQLIDDIFELIDPIDFDRSRLIKAIFYIINRLCEVLERRILEEQGCKSTINTMNNSKLQLNRDLNYILRGKKIRKYGEMPEKMGLFERIAPSECHDKIQKIVQSYKIKGGKSCID